MEFRDLTEALWAIRKKDISATELCEHYSQRAVQLNPRVGAYISLNQELKKQAKIIDTKLASGEEPGPWQGLPWPLRT